MKLSAFYLAALGDAYTRKNPYNRERSLRNQANNDLSVFEEIPMHGLGGAQLWQVEGCESVGGPIFESESKTLPSSGGEGSDNKVVGGNDAGDLDWPWIAGLSFEYTSKYARFCGGTLVADEWVLSARHCLLSYYPDVWNQTKVSCIKDLRIFYFYNAQ